MADNNGFAYFLLGLGAGVAVGILLAPKAGDETREFLRSKADEGVDYVRSRATEGAEFVKRKSADLKDSATHIYETGKSNVTRQRDNLSAAVDAGKQAYQDAVTNFEQAPGGEGV
jgi:gas vesicle protein